MHEHGIELVEPPRSGRRYEVTRRVHLNDTDASGRLRIDALARYLQDVATDDAYDAGRADGRGVWVLRRIDILVDGAPALYETVTLLTFCSGTGPAWAERRTRVTDAAGAVVAEAVAVWVYVDRERGRPLALDDEFAQWYGEAATGRRVSGRLHLQGPAAASSSRVWPVRATDFDVLDHVNNVRSFEAVVDELARRLPGRSVARATVEYRGTLERGDVIELHSAVIADAPDDAPADVTVDVPVDDAPDEPAGAAAEATLAATLDAWLVVGGEVRVSARLRAGSHLH